MVTVGYGFVCSATNGRNEEMYGRVRLNKAGCCDSSYAYFLHFGLCSLKSNPCQNDLQLVNHFKLYVKVDQGGTLCESNSYILHLHLQNVNSWKITNLLKILLDFPTFEYIAL